MHDYKIYPVVILVYILKIMCPCALCTRTQIKCAFCIVQYLCLATRLGRTRWHKNWRAPWEPRYFTLHCPPAHHPQTFSPAKCARPIFISPADWCIEMHKEKRSHPRMHCTEYVCITLTYGQQNSTWSWSNKD